MTIREFFTRNSEINQQLADWLMSLTLWEAFWLVNGTISFVIFMIYAFGSDEPTIESGWGG